MHDAETFALISGRRSDLFSRCWDFLIAVQWEIWSKKAVRSSFYWGFAHWIYCRIYSMTRNALDEIAMQCNAIKNSATMKLPLYTKMGSRLCMIQFVRSIYAHANIQHAITLNSCPCIVAGDRPPLNTWSKAGIFLTFQYHACWQKHRHQRRNSWTARCCCLNLRCCFVFPYNVPYSFSNVGMMRKHIALFRYLSVSLVRWLAFGLIV